MESEKNQLYGDKQAVEQEKVGLREELVRVEQEKLDIDSEKSGITQTLELSEQTRERLEDEIMALNKDRAELTEQLNAVSKHSGGTCLVKGLAHSLFCCQDSRSISP